MVWWNVEFDGSSDTPQSYDEEKGTFLGVGETSVFVDRPLQIVDMATTKETTNQHQFRIYTNGESKLNDFFSGQISPDTEGRLSWANQGIVIGAQRTLQIRGAQLDGNTAEKVILTVQAVPAGA